MVSEEGLLTCLRGRSFDDLLTETIDDVLKQVFGDESVKLILQHVKKSGFSKWEGNPKSAKVFAGALREILGSGSVPVENLILEGLYFRLELKFEERGYGFLGYIKELRSKCWLTMEG